MTKALDGLRVLDLSRVLAGPWATQILGDLGAEIIKIERPGAGDDTRGWGPPWLADAQGAPTHDSAYFLSANRNKRSVTLDISRPEGQRIARALAQRSDILVENFKIGGLAAYGLDYASLKALNPRLIYCSITGFGQTGPYAAKAGYDFMMQGMTGLMSVTGAADGEPQKVGVALIDVMTGLYAAIAVLAAVQQRHASGEGQYIDLALFDVGVACLANQALNYLVGGVVPTRLGNAHPNIVPYQAFPTADGDIILAIGNDGQFARFAQLAGRPGWAEDSRFLTNATRVANRTVLTTMIAALMGERSTADWLALLEPAGIPCGPINRIDQLFADPQAKARGLALELPHPAGAAPGVASPLRLSASDRSAPSAPPLLGADTDAVLEQLLGINAPERETLRATSVI